MSSVPTYRVVINVYEWCKRTYTLQYKQTLVINGAIQFGITIQYEHW